MGLLTATPGSTPSAVAAPEYVPHSLKDLPRRGIPLPAPESWVPKDQGHLGPRAGDLGPAQPVGHKFGYPGPDQGYALKLARVFENRLRLRSGEAAEDALAGAVLVALKRASLFGRAPVIHDLDIALTVWGFLDAVPDDLAQIRGPLFEGVSHGQHHYADQRRIVESVPEATLRKTPQQVRDAARSDWRSLLRLTGDLAPA